jgi:Domain of unknown function (DUF1924)
MFPTLIRRRTRRSCTPAAAAAFVLALAVTALGSAAAARAASPSELLAGYRQAAGTAPAADRGQKLFTTAHGRDWSCSSCHGAVPTQGGRHAATGKPIAALAPAANAERFTDPARVEKWFRRNCNDVIGRECTAGEKADVLAWLMTLAP